MHTQALRDCDACGKPLSVIVYDINVQCSIISRTGTERLAGPVSKIVDLQLCPECMCGLNSHALPLAMDRRADQLNPPRVHTHCRIYQWPNDTKGSAA